MNSFGFVQGFIYRYIFLTKCLTLCLKLSRVVKNFLPPVLNFVPNYPGDLDPTRQHFRLRDEHARIHSNN